MIFNNELSALDNRGTARTRHCAPRGNPRKYVLGQSEVIVQGLTVQPCRRYAIASCRLFAGGSHRFFLTYVPSTFQATCLHRLLLPPPARLTLANTNQAKAFIIPRSSSSCLLSASLRASRLRSLFNSCISLALPSSRLAFDFLLVYLSLSRWIQQTIPFKTMVFTISPYMGTTKVSDAPYATVRTSTRLTLQGAQLSCVR